MRYSKEVTTWTDFVDGEEVLGFEMSGIEVDGVVSDRSAMHTYDAPMFHIKNDNSGWSSPSSVRFTDEPFDEELWIKNGDCQAPPIKYFD